MDLFLVRHGPAVERGTGDYEDPDRPLTTIGRRRVTRMARSLRDWMRGIPILTSPYRRCRQTARLLSREWSSSKPEAVDFLGAEQGAREALEPLQARCRGEDRLLTVGHEPQLSELLALLVGPVRVDFKKGALAWVDWQEGQGCLRAFLWPGLLRRLR
ncbi:MAG: histidine phosphatase family protein [Candidatus Eremiobacterota bacterium]